MHINFNRELREEHEERIPKLVISHLSEDLPKDTTYVMDENGNLVLTSTTGSMTIGGLELVHMNEYKEKLGQDISKEDILRYSYNAQKPLRFRPKREGYLLINGEDMSIDKFIYDNSHDSEYINGELRLTPPPFPEGQNITIGCEQYNRIIKVHRMANDSLDEFLLQSEQEEPLSLRLKGNRKENMCTISVTVALKYTKSIRDIVETIYIYNAFVENKGTINGEATPITNNEHAASKFNENYAFFWKKTLDVENILNKIQKIKFSPPQEDLYEGEIAMVEELYQSFVLKKPVRWADPIESLDGNSKIKENINLEEIKDQKIMLAYPELRKIELFGTTFRIVALNGIVDAVVSDYKTEDDRVILFFKDDETESRPFKSTIDFLSEEDMKIYQREAGDALVEYFQEADSLDELVDKVISSVN